MINVAKAVSVVLWVAGVGMMVMGTGDCVVTQDAGIANDGNMRWFFGGALTMASSAIWGSLISSKWFND